MRKGVVVGVAVALASASCAGAQTLEQYQETKRALIRQFLDCVTSQAVTIDDFTSDVSTIARGAVVLCKAEAHAAAVSNAGSMSELVPSFRASLEASGIETGI